MLLMRMCNVTVFLILVTYFFLKQKTAYEMRISDWSSDVCSSDLPSGVEAACASARMGARTALVSFDLDAIGAMSCNPAIGGLGKGHLVCEVDALDGVIARAADASAIHYRMQIGRAHV